MSHNLFNDDYLKPADILKTKMRNLKKPSSIKAQFKLIDKSINSMFSSYNHTISNNKHKRNRDSNSLIHNLTVKNPPTKTMNLERQVSALTKKHIYPTPTHLCLHTKNKSTINISNHQINQSIDMVNKAKITIKKTEAFKHIEKKYNDKHPSHVTLFMKNNSNNRSRSKGNLDQTNTTLTKTSSDHTTTTSKRLFNDNILKTSAHKMYIDNFKNSIMKNLSSSLKTQLQKKKHLQKENTSNYSNINTEFNEQSNNIPALYTNTEILKTIANSVIEELEPITLDTHKLFVNSILPQKRSSDQCANAREAMANMTPCSGTIISDDSPFNSKPQSNSNTHNNSFSFKQFSNKHSSSSSINQNDKKSLGSLSQSISLSKSNSGQDIEQTVSYTYSDDQTTGKRSKKGSKKSNIDQDDFKAFAEKINERLKNK